MWRIICHRLPSMPRRVLMRRILPLALSIVLMMFLMLNGFFDLVQLQQEQSILVLRLDEHIQSFDVLREKTSTNGSTSSSSSDFPFEYVINEPDFCTRNGNLDIINVVGVAPWEIRARARIRRLWGNTTWRSLSGFSTLFFLGMTEDPRIMRAVEEESQTHKDIVQFSFLDTYDNLTIKTLSGLHWISHFCKTPSWVLKSDADVVINIFELKDYLAEYDQKHNGTRKELICKRRHSTSPCRKSCRHVKWQVTWEEYPHPRYPSYCQGPGYIIPRHLIDHLYRIANKTHPFRMEDVYYTGILAEKLGIDKVNIAHRFPWRPRMWQESFVTTDIMILELDKGVGRGASSLVWSNILHNRGFKDDSCANETKNLAIRRRVIGNAALIA